MARRAKSCGGAHMRRIVVVGGGLAGITAALDCASAGATVTLLESRGRLGGAVYSFTRDGIVADNGQHVFLRCCTAYRELLCRVGAAHLVTLQPRLSIPVLAPGGEIAWLRRSGLPAPLHLAGALARYRYLGLRQRASLALAMSALRRIDPDDPTADARSFGEWLSEHRQTEEAVRVMWELIARPTLNLVAGDASLAQAAYVFQRGLLCDRTAGDVGFAQVPLGEIHDVTVRGALARAGVEVHLHLGATAIVPGEDGFRVEAGAAPPLAGDAVILAVSHDRAARLLPTGSGVEVSRLAALGSSPIVNLHVVYDRQVLGLPFAAAVRTPVQWVFDRTKGAGLDRGQYLAISLSAADAELAMTVDDLRGRFLPALAELLPASGDVQVESFFATREHAATFRVEPGSRALRPGPRTAIAGLVLAGAWTDTGWPATMEGAVRSGHAAAREALSFSLRKGEVRAAVPA
jgi:hydroxysqualene dehydroxylase